MDTPATLPKESLCAETPDTVQSSQLKPKKIKKEDELLQLAVSVLQKPQTHEDIIGQQVAHTLKMIKDPVSKQLTMFNIQKVLNDSYMEYLRKSVQPSSSSTTLDLSDAGVESLIEFLSAGPSDE